MMIEFDNSTLVPASIIGAGLALAVIGMIRYRLKITRLKRYVHAEGRVVHHEEVSSGEIGFAYNPVVEFVDSRQREIRFVTEAVAAKESFPLGSVWSVVYDPEDASQAFIDQPSTKFGEEIVWWVLSGFMIFGGLIFLAVLHVWK